MGAGQPRQVTQFAGMGTRLLGTVDEQAAKLERQKLRAVVEAAEVAEYRAQLVVVNLLEPLQKNALQIANDARKEFKDLKELLNII